MGNFPFAGVEGARLFAASGSWIEGAAVNQLNNLMKRCGMVAVAGMPDLHPGHHGPVGCAALAKGVVHADIVGTDIGCGMQMHVLDLPARKLKLDRAVERMMALEGRWAGDAHAALAADGLARLDEYASALGAIGGGNHFCETQMVDEIVDAAMASSVGLEAGGLALLVHSGSRGLGAAVLARHRKSAEIGADQALPLDGAGADYLADHDLAVRFAALNRRVIASRAAEALRCAARETIDSAHNVAVRYGDYVLHRKGAAPADSGLVPVPGSRGARTFIVRPLAGAPQALASLAHGAGRKHERASMAKRLRLKADGRAGLERNPFGGRVICSDRALLVEEAPQAYKDIEKVVADLEREGLAKVVAIMKPLITFKTARVVDPKGARR